MKVDHAQQLIAYGCWLIAHVAGRSPGSPPPWVAGFTGPLGWTRDEVPTAPLRAILALIDLEGTTVAPAYVRPVPLGVAGDDREWPLFPVGAKQAAADRADLYRGFQAAGGTEETSFDRFFYLMRKFASTLPNTYGEPGVSLFEQWKIVAALVTIAGSTAAPPAALGLVKGDISGIQRTINTITPKGAAKGMRGRSAFIQLLGDALVGRLLAELGLSQANVVYDAGANFVLLTGWTDGAEGTAEHVRKVADEVNEVLLSGAVTGAARFDGFRGDLAVALAAMPLEGSLAALRYERAGDGKESSVWQQAENRLQEALTAAKNRPFGDLARKPEGFRALFQPEPADTGDFCAVCRRLRRANEPQFEAMDAEEAAGDQVCPECRGFNELANDMGDGDRALVLSDAAPGCGPADAWQVALHAVSGMWYALERSDAVSRGGRPAGRRVLALDPDAFDSPAYDGFRWLAHTTPTTPDGAIKSNDAIADTSTGIKRLGVLRMDVDNLADLIVRGLPRRTPMQTAELSQALERFFAGWLDHICHRVDRGEKLFYVLFAGGDDLFVIGPWDLMPTLAVAIREDFDRYCSGHPAIHLSTGIAVVGEHAPTHQAADESHDALSKAKHLDCDGSTAKNAVTFLGHTLHWEQFAEVVGLKDDIFDLADHGGLGNAVITRLLAIEGRYRHDCERPPYGKRARSPARMAYPVYFGPWMWQQVYAIARLEEGQGTEARYKLRDLQERLVAGKQIPQLGLAARWAQLLLRKGA